MRVCVCVHWTISNSIFIAVPSKKAKSDAVSRSKAEPSPRKPIKENIEPSVEKKPG